MVELGSSGEIKRDAFLHYLLGANIILLLIASMLAFGAAKAMYF